MITVHSMQYSLAESVKLSKYVRSRGCTVSSGQNDYPGALAGAFF